MNIAACNQNVLFVLLKEEMCRKIVVTTPKYEISEKHVLWKFRSSIQMGGQSETDSRFQQQLGERT